MLSSARRPRRRKHGFSKVATLRHSLGQYLLNFLDLLKKSRFPDGSESKPESSLYKGIHVERFCARQKRIP